MNILFLCVANSARSQMAEGLAKEILGDSHNIQSAGSIPSGVVHPYAISTLREMGIDISNNISNSIDNIDSIFLQDLDYLITLCYEEACPILASNARFLNWACEDPVSQAFNEADLERAFRITAEKINNKILIFKDGIDNDQKLF